MTISYDIFDTCLIRACGCPNIITDILAYRVLGEHTEIALINDFSLIRKQGEGRARETLINQEKEDITLEEIYQQCDFSSLTSLSRSEIMDMEMKVEEEMLIPAHCIKQEISELHKAGKTITFISDMYLPFDFIKKLLVKNGFFIEGDHLYISCETGKTKATGHLYDFVHQELGANFHHWQHRGDNQHSDYDIPQKKGIKARIVNHAFSYYERLMEKNNYTIISTDIQKTSAICRSIRLSMDDTPTHLFAADFIAPLMTTFVHHIFEDANSRGLHHLYFIARDAFILYQIAQHFTPFYPKISIHYLYASRQSLYNPDENCIKYLRQEGLTRPHSAIVDMIGSRRCQQCMNNLLRQYGYNEVFAYYYQVVAYRIQSSDSYDAMYFHEKMAGSSYYHHVSHPLFEQYFGITDQLRTIGYRKEGETIQPIFEEDLLNMDYKKQVFDINNMVCNTFAQYYVRVCITNPIQCNNIVHAVFAHFCQIPRKEYLYALNKFFSTSSGTIQEPLLVKRNLIDIIFNKKNYLRWKQGNMIYNSGLLYRFILAFLQWYHYKKI